MNYGEWAKLNSDERAIMYAAYATETQVAGVEAMQSEIRRQVGS